MSISSECQESLEFLMRLIQNETASDRPHIARVSIALGLLEIPATSKREDARIWPENLEAEVEKHFTAFKEFVKGVHEECGKKKIDFAREKIKLLADRVWAKLTGVFSKDVLHAQHLGCFTPFLLMGKLRGKRQLDCAGVVTTVFAACKILEIDFHHTDLKELCMQVSEDHCWLTLDRSGGRLGSVEITTDRAEKRGSVVGESEWKGWLYSGGCATVMDAKRAFAAMATSINPSIVDRPVTGVDSEEMQFLQCKILEWMDENRRDLMYPNSLCTLADLYEVAWQDSLNKAILTPNGSNLKLLLDESRQNIDTLFQRGINDGKHVFWYPFSYRAGSALRFSKFLVEKCPTDVLGGKEPSAKLALSALDAGWTSLNKKGGGGVLKAYRFASVDEQLYKDIEGLLEESVKAFDALAKFGGFDGESHWMGTMLEFLDALCHLFDGATLPSKWVSLFLKIAKLIPQENREKGADAEVTSPAMLKSLPLWGPLKGSAIRQALEVLELKEDQGEGRRKRRRQK